MLTRLSQEGIRIVLVLFAEQNEKKYDIQSLAKTGIIGVMLDTMDKSSGSLRQKLPGSVLQQFVSDAEV